jgi:DNA-binding response OmpR family regulator
MSTIVVIEDDAAIRKFISVNLRVRGYSVIEAADAQEGLNALRTHQTNLALVDNRLPGMSGVELARLIGLDKTLAAIPLVILSGAGPDDLGDLSDIQSVSGVLMKPISVEELLAVVTAHVQ